MPRNDETKKPGFDYLRLIIYVCICSGVAFYIFYRVKHYFHNLIAALAAGLIVLVLLVWKLYALDNGRRY